MSEEYKKAHKLLKDAEREMNKALKSIGGVDFPEVYRDALTARFTAIGKTCDLLQAALAGEDRNWEEELFFIEQERHWGWECSICRTPWHPLGPHECSCLPGTY
jgi:hypothetical protein